MIGLALFTALAAEPVPDELFATEHMSFQHPAGWTTKPVEALTPGGHAVWLSDGGSGWMHIERVDGTIPDKAIFEAALAGRSDARMAKGALGKKPTCLVGGQALPCRHGTFVVTPRTSDTPGLPPKSFPVDQRLFPREGVFVLSAFSVEAWPVREPGVLRVLGSLEAL